MKTVDQEKLWHTCDTVMVLPTPWRQKRMGFYSIWLFMTTLNIPLITPSPHRQNTADYCIDSCFSDIVSQEDNHRTMENKKNLDSSHNHSKGGRKKKRRQGNNTLDVGVRCERYCLQVYPMRRLWYISNWKVDFLSVKYNRISRLLQGHLKSKHMSKYPGSSSVFEAPEWPLFLK